MLLLDVKVIFIFLFSGSEFLVFMKSFDVLMFWVIFFVILLGVFRYIVNILSKRRFWRRSFIMLLALLPFCSELMRSLQSAQM